MTEQKYFFRTGERTWITHVTQQFPALHSLRCCVKCMYPDAIIQILEDVQIEEPINNMKNAIEQAFQTGIGNLGTYIPIKYYFIQITFTNDLDNSSFIMDVGADTVRLAGYCYFHNYN